VGDELDPTPRDRGHDLRHRAGVAVGHQEFFALAERVHSCGRLCAFDVVLACRESVVGKKALTKPHYFASLIPLWRLIGPIS